MDQYADFLIGRHRNSGLLVDTNLLLLYFVGVYQPTLIESWRRTASKYASVDFETLQLVLDQFKILVVTPYILAEVSNLLGGLCEPARSGCIELLSLAIKTNMYENYAPSATLVEDQAFLLYGLADASIVEVSSEAYLILTDDLRLSAHLQSLGVDVLNFNHLRWLAY